MSSHLQNLPLLYAFDPWSIPCPAQIRTAGGTGIMLYVSLFEHTVRVMGDDNIAEAIDPEGWDEIRDVIIDGIRQGKPAEGLEQAVAISGYLLARDFPVQPGDVNELTNELRLID